MINIVNALKPFSVLDFGCGTGKVLNMINAEWRVGIDLSKPAIKEGIRIYEDIEFFLGDESLLRKFGENCFDISYTISVLNHLPLPECQQIVKELKRISKRIYAIESLDIWSKMCFPHDYQAMDFIGCDYKWKSPATKALYKLYEWAKNG
jgi:ubiquinone/menaquinone biosynthesis C-methylase UbiE